MKGYGSSDKQFSGGQLFEFLESLEAQESLSFLLHGFELLFLHLFLISSELQCSDTLDDDIVLDLFKAQTDFSVKLSVHDDSFDFDEVDSKLHASRTLLFLLGISTFTIFKDW